MKDKLLLIEQQNNALHRLNEIAAISKISPKETLRKALEIGRQYFGLEFGIVSHIVGEAYTVDVQSSPPDTLHDGQLFALGLTYCKTTLDIDDVLAITDVTRSEYVGHPCHQELGLISYIGAVIRVDSKIHGTINFSSPNARQLEYDQIDDEFMRLLARWAGSFLERQSTLDELSFTKKRFEMLFENNASGILLVDKDCNIIMTNKRICEILGYPRNELLGQKAKVVHIDETSYKTMKEDFLKIKEDAYIKREYQLKRKDNRHIWCEFFGSPIELAEHDTGIVWSILDITTQKKLRDMLKLHATTDYLTGLNNRRYFTSRLEEELSRIKRDKKRTTALMMFDLDHFKLINDSLGHLMGDAVLKRFAEVLKKNLRKTDIAGRIGGEEFAMVLPDTDLEKAAVLANRIREEVIDQTTTVEGEYAHLTVSIGLTLLTYDDFGFESAFARADSALYLAKKNGRNRVERSP